MRRRVGNPASVRRYVRMFYAARLEGLRLKLEVGRSQQLRRGYGAQSRANLGSIFGSVSRITRDGLVGSAGARYGSLPVRAFAGHLSHLEMCRKDVEAA